MPESNRKKQTKEERKAHKHEYYLKNLESIKAKKKAYQEANREKVLQQRRDSWKRHRDRNVQYLRKRYSEDKKKYLDMCKSYRESHKEEISQKLFNIKKTIIDHYGGACVLCGERNIGFLTLDHINNDGHIERRSKKYKEGRIQYYRRIIREGFPNTLQVLCWSCNRKKYFEYLRCKPKSQNYYAIYVRKRNAMLKERVLSHYGNKCECCSETDMDKLSIDHIHNDGAKHRKDNKMKSGQEFYKWLIKNNFPDGFRCLCHNCNMGRYMNDNICPHKDSKYYIWDGT